MSQRLENAVKIRKHCSSRLESKFRETFAVDQLRVLRRILPARWRHPAEDRDDAEPGTEVWLQQNTQTGLGRIISGKNWLGVLLYWFEIHFTYQGPPHHYWYLYLDKLFPGKSKSIVIKKILADQAVAAPFFAITFIYGAGLLEGNSLSRIFNNLINKSLNSIQDYSSLENTS